MAVLYISGPQRHPPCHIPCGISYSVNSIHTYTYNAGHVHDRRVQLRIHRQDPGARFAEQL